MNLRELNEKIQKLNLQQAVQDWISENENLLLKLLKEQLYRGEVGNTFYTYSSPSYQKEKLQMNPTARGKVDLYYTGKFYEGFYFDADNEGISFYSKDSKTKDLETKYQNLFKVNANTKAKLVVRFKNELVGYL